MKALHYMAPGEMKWQEIPAPQITLGTDVIIRPTAVAACDLDRVIAAGKSHFPGPFVMGHEFCGVIVEVGDEVAGFKPGDEVVASFQPSCGACSHCGRGFSSVCSTVPHSGLYGVGPAGGDWPGAFADLILVHWAEFNLRKIPPGINSASIASGSDNLLDGLRAVDLPLSRYPGASVLVAGSGSIPLYGILAAKFLGADKVSFASNDSFALETAESMGAECLPVTDWPKRFTSHDITFDCTGSESGLSAVIKSTSPFGVSTSASIYFSKTTPMPMLDMYSKGIEFKTGRVNSASQLDRMLELVTQGMQPDLIQPAYIPMLEAAEVMNDYPVSQKLIFTI